MNTDFRVLFYPSANGAALPDDAWPDSPRLPAANRHPLAKGVALTAVAIACALSASVGYAQTVYASPYSVPQTQAGAAYRGSDSIPTNPPWVDNGQPKTRAEVKAELARLEAAGYEPSDWVHYPQNLHRAETRAQIEDSGAVYRPSADQANGF